MNLRVNLFTNVSIVVFLILKGSICCGLLGKVALVTADIVLLQLINNLETGKTFKCSAAPVVPVAHTQRVFTVGSDWLRMSKRRWVEFRISQTISCSAPVSRRHRPSSPAAVGKF